MEVSTATGSVSSDVQLSYSRSEGDVSPDDVEWKHKENEVWHLNKDGKENDPNSYYRYTATSTNLRGKKYMEDKKKYPSKEAAYSLVCCKCFQTDHKMLHSAESIKSLQSFLKENQDKEFFIINWLVPGGHYTVVNLYVRTLPHGEDEIFDALLVKYRMGDDTFRSERFKFICDLLEAPAAILTMANTMLGGLRPALIGQKLTAHHFTGDNYLEIDVDTGSSSIVSFATRSIVRTFSSIVANIGFVIEGRDEGELPERMLAIHQYGRVDIDKIAMKYDYVPPEAKAEAKKKSEGKSKSRGYSLMSFFGRGSQTGTESSSKSKGSGCESDVERGQREKLL
mmetsp:Transcript_25479/g.45274  ORF Transcript_25479/g.45274 Transcript_25479/m.45274 type:complete len:339 (+) Transcript_25479:66-1082(+)|eukprot:CAMPEP_0197522486 /NCGR_PEP_ID=MMETSP1318-20131121/7621_1 /TAXON_ID=552666 /ORGANISM="Partenskyella glossopodia, Strain RCC365" /LENGTH=338 /DNA_ID=CAMNT_0043074885 /DNA_START=66 /DNA_END=1082 /DNA_ORIENTATION=-